MNDRRKRIAVLITGLGTGGAENHLVQVLPRLKDKFDISVISLTDENTKGDILRKEGIKVSVLGLRGNLLNIFGVISRFRRIVRSEKPDVMITYLIHANLFGRVFGRMAGVKRIINSVRNNYSGRHVLNFFDRITSGRVDIYAPNSEAVKRFISENIKVKKEKIMVIPNCVDTTMFDDLRKRSTKEEIRKKRKDTGFSEKDFVIGCIANLEQKKDHRTLLKGFSMIGRKDAKLMLIGDGKLRKELERYAKELGIGKRVVFLGKRNDAKELLQTMDIFILPSLHEGMSNALLEAMASGKPIIVSDIDENTELIKDRMNGITFKTGDAAELKEAMERLSSDRKYAEKLGNSARESAKNGYSIDKVIKMYEAMLMK